MRRTFAIGSKTMFVFHSNRSDSPVIYLNTYSDEGQQLFEATQAASYPPFTLVAISDLDWNHDMASWNSPADFKKGELFTRGDDYLWLLVEEIMPEVEKGLSRPPAWRGIAGYSLAGLFALYAIDRTDVFSRVGCMSGSLWFSGFKEYVFSHEPKRWLDCIYFALGDKAAKTRNSVLKTVQENTEEIQSFTRAKVSTRCSGWIPEITLSGGIEWTVAGSERSLSR